MNIRHAIRHFFTFVFIIAATAALVGSVNAATIFASYEFTGGSLASLDTDTSTTASNFAAGVGISSFLSDPLLEVASDSTPAVSPSTNFDEVISDSLENDVYLSFTLTIPDTTAINITSINFTYSQEKSDDAAVGLFSSVTGFNNTSDSLAGLFTPFGTNESLSGPFDLSGNTAFQNLSDTAVEFRFYLGDGSSDQNKRKHRLDDVILEGVIIPKTPDIPEPSTAILAGLGLLGVCFRRRRK